MVLKYRGGVLDDVLGLEDELEDAFYSRWSRTLQVLKISCTRL